MNLLMLNKDCLTTIYSYLEPNKNQEYFSNYVIPYIVLLKYKKHKKVSLCKRCKTIRVYNDYCTKCDLEIWFEIT